MIGAPLLNTQINHDICQFGNPFPGWGQTQKFGNVEMDNGGIPYYLPWNIWINDYQYEKLLLSESLNSDGQ